jgi:CO/xanthine dehydrogenase FAD-binding subunit
VTRYSAHRVLAGHSHLEQEDHLDTLKSAVDYYYPDSIEAAWRLKAEYGDRARFVAGGTDLLLLLEREQAHPEALIDLMRIPTLQRLDVSGGQAAIGAAVTYSQILACEPVCAAVPFLMQAIRTIGGVQVRNIATLVGNITNASPAADTLPALYVLDARVHLAGPGGIRALPIESFVLGVRRTALEAGELVTHVTFGLPGAGWYGTFEKLGLRHAMAIAVVSAALLLHIADGHVDAARIALGSVAPATIRVPEAEAVLAGRVLDDNTIEHASQLASAATRPIDDVRGSAGYRKLAAAGLLRRALHSLRDEIERKN